MLVMTFFSFIAQVDGANRVGGVRGIVVLGCRHHTTPTSPPDPQHKATIKPYQGKTDKQTDRINKLERNLTGVQLVQVILTLICELNEEDGDGISVLMLIVTFVGLIVAVVEVRCQPKVRICVETGTRAI